MSSPATTRTVVLVAFDPTEASAEALDRGVQLARLLPGGELHLLNVITLATGDVDAPLRADGADVERERKLLEDAMATMATKVGAPVHGHLALGDPKREIVQLAVDLAADFVIVGSHQKGPLTRVLIGSVSDFVVRKAPCTVIVARAKAEAEVVPEIEPPCPDCAEAQRRTAGKTLWCARHSEHHPHGRLHYETPESFAMGSMLIRP